MKVARVWFALVLRLFPAEFRDRHGAAMRETLAWAYAERRTAGWPKLAAFLVRTSLDLVVSGFLQRIAGRRHGRVPRRPGRAGGGSGFVSWLDIKLGLRMLVKHPGLTLVATFALAVGIPVGLAPAHVVDGVMAPLPVPEGERIRSLRLWSPLLGRAVSPTSHDFEAWSGALSSFEVLGAFRETAQNFDAGERRGPAVRGAAVTASTFAILGVRPVVGRGIQPGDETPGADDVVVLGFDLWQSRYSGDPDIVGRTVRLGGRPHTVVGVMPRGFKFPTRHSVWTPLRIPPGTTAASAVPVQVFGRLERGVADGQVQSELAVVAERSAPPDRDPRLQAQAGPFALVLLPGVHGGLRGTREFLAFQAIALLVLLVACVNAGMLMFARMATRGGEMAVRTALGASRARIVTQSFVECLVMAVLASGAGLVLLEASFALMWRVVPEWWATSLPWWISWDVGPKTALRALALAAVSAAVAGVVPAVRATGKSVHSTIQRARAKRTGARFGGLSGVLIVADVAVAVGALGFAVAAADLVQGDGSAGRVGIPAEEYLAATVHLSSTTVPEESGSAPRSERGARMAATQEELVRRLRAEPGVRGVAVADALPRMQHDTRRVEAEGMELPDGRRGVSIRTARVAVDYFASLDRPIVAGRDFEPGDLGGARTGVIVNTSFVERVLGGGNAVGRRIRFLPWGDGEPGPWKAIVGVVGHLGMRIISGEDQGVYEPFAPGDLEEIRLGIHVGEDPTSFVHRLRTVAGQVDPGAIVSVTGPLDEVYEGDWYLVLAASLGAGLFVAVLLALAASGIYALMSFAVAERTTEIGIRTALGAGRYDLVRSVARRALLQLSVGVLLGMPLAAAFLVNDGGPRSVGSARTLAVGIGVLVLVALAACTGPTLRALQVQPDRALREEG